MTKPQQQPLYTPPKNLITNLDRFRHFINRRYSLTLTTYPELHNFSTTRLADFWLAIWDFCDIKSPGPPGPVFADHQNASAEAKDIPPIDTFPKFFEYASINYAENALKGQDDDLAVIDMNETNQQSPDRYTWKEMRALVARYAALLRREGVGLGDVIVLVGGNSARSLALLLAAASIGAVFSSFAHDVGEKALADRVGQLQPRILFVECRYRYNGKVNDITGKIRSAVRAVERPPRMVVLKGEVSEFKNASRIEDLMEKESAEDLTFTHVPFNTPFIVMFSSGTTGTPKGIVHSQGGLLLNGVKSHTLHNNFTPSDIHFHYSGIGWTLWNISLGALFCRAALILYDGSPFHPTPTQFLTSIFSQGVTGYGGSPRYFSELQKLNLDLRPITTNNLKSSTKLRNLLSTGALLTPGVATYLSHSFTPPNTPQINFTGGTELCGNFFSGTPSLPIYAGEVTVPELGMDVCAYHPTGDNSQGISVPDGAPGELVCRKPFPNMPVFFLHDPDFKRYRKAYFERFRGVWHHGDLIRKNVQTGGWVVLGRSDGVLNPSGVRFGTSELYNVLSTAGDVKELVQDALAVGVQRNTETKVDDAERVMLFVKLAEGGDGGGDRAGENSPVLAKHTEKKIKDAIAKGLSRRHVPEWVFQVGEVPHNANGKKMEIQVKSVINTGATALAAMTLTDAERKMLEGFVRFHDVEKLVCESLAEPAAPLAKDRRGGGGGGGGDRSSKL